MIINLKSLCPPIPIALTWVAFAVTVGTDNCCFPRFFTDHIEMIPEHPNVLNFTTLPVVVMDYFEMNLSTAELEYKFNCY